MSKIFKSVESVREFFDDESNRRKLPFDKRLVDVNPLSGGYLNKVFRVRFEDDTTVIFKYYPAKIDYETPMDYSQDRYFIEKTALDLLGKEVCLKDCQMKTPKCIYFDDDLFVLIMEDCGENLVSLSEFLRSDFTQTSESNKIEMLNKLARELNVFYTTIFNEVNAKIKQAHMKTFENKITWDFLNKYYVQMYKDQAKVYNVEKEMDVYIRSHKLLEQPKNESDAYFCLGDLWPNSILFDLEKKIIYCIDWEMSRFETKHRDIEQLFANLWVMKQDSNYYDTKLCSHLINQLQREYFGSEDRDWRLNCNSETITEFILLVAALLAEAHIKRKDSDVILAAIREVESLESSSSRSE